MGPDIFKTRKTCFRVANKPEAISSNRNAKWVSSTESAFFVKLDYFRFAEPFTGNPTARMDSSDANRILGEMT